MGLPGELKKSKVIAEYASGAALASPAKEYVYSGSQLLATLAGTSVTYHHPDHLSNRAETDSAGNVVRSFGQFPFGETWYETGTADKWKFTSYERDSGAGESGLDYAMFRYYGSGQGRFMSPDLLGGQSEVPESLNRYAYVLNNPGNFIDPFGLRNCLSTNKDNAGAVVKCKHDEASGGEPGSGGSGGSEAGGGGAGGCGGPCGGGNPGGGGGGNPSSKKDNKKDKQACKQAAKDKRDQAKSNERNQLTRDFFNNLAISQGVTTVAYCAGGAIVGGGLAAIESFGALTGVGGLAGCVGGSLISVEALPLNTLASVMRHN